jgi:hypothetical protein
MGSRDGILRPLRLGDFARDILFWLRLCRAVSFAPLRLKKALEVGTLFTK